MIDTITYLIVGNQKEYQSWVDSNRRIWIDNPERHASPLNPEKLLGYKRAKVIIFPSAYKKKTIEQIIQIQKEYEKAIKND